VFECVPAIAGASRHIAAMFARASMDPKAVSLGYALAFLLFWWRVALYLDKQQVRIRI